LATSTAAVSEFLEPTAPNLSAETATTASLVSMSAELRNRSERLRVDAGVSDLRRSGRGQGVCIHPDALELAHGRRQWQRPDDAVRNWIYKDRHGSFKSKGTVRYSSALDDVESISSGGYL
jgi:hypothetical protein